MAVRESEGEPRQGAEQPRTREGSNANTSTRLRTEAAAGMERSTFTPENPSEEGSERAPPPDARSVVASALAQLPEESLIQILDDLRTNGGASEDDIGIKETLESSASVLCEETEKEGEMVVSSSSHRGGVRLLSEKNSFEGRLSSIEKQVGEMKQVVGIPEPEVSGYGKFRLAVIGAINNKLVLLGHRAAFVIALLVMLINLAFVVGFTVSQSRRCTKFAGLINGYNNELETGNRTLPPAIDFLLEGERAGMNVYQDMYGREKTHICSTEEQLSYAPEDGSAVRTIWKPCVLSGFNCSDYEQEFSEYCRYLSCQYPCEFSGRVFDLEDYFDLKHAAAHDDLLSEITEGTDCVCNNQVRIIYYVCPEIAPLLGSAFGYLFLLELLSLIFLVGLYFLITKRKRAVIKKHGEIVAEQILAG